MAKPSNYTKGGGQSSPGKGMGNRCERGWIRLKSVADDPLSESSRIQLRLACCPHKRLQIDEQMLPVRFLGQRDQSAVGPVEIAEVNDVYFDALSPAEICHRMNAREGRIVFRQAICNEKDHIRPQRQCCLQRSPVIRAAYANYFLYELRSTSFVFRIRRVQIVVAVIAVTKQTWLEIIEHNLKLMAIGKLPEAMQELRLCKSEGSDFTYERILAIESEY